MRLPTIAILWDYLVAYLSASGGTVTPNGIWTKLAGTTTVAHTTGAGLSQSVNNRILTSTAKQYFFRSRGMVEVTVADSVVRLAVSKNGADPTAVAIEMGWEHAAQGVYHFDIAWLDTSNGTDFYEIWAFAAGATTEIEALTMQTEAKEAPGVQPDLLTIIQNLGGVLLIDPVTASSYTLSGSTITGVDNRVTDVALTEIEGDPQYDATGFNGGPSFAYDGTGDWIGGTESAVYNIMLSGSAFTIIMCVQLPAPDVSNAIFSVGNSASNSGYRYVGAWNNAGGRWRVVAQDDAAVTTTILGDGGTTTASPVILELTSPGTTATLKANRVVVPGLNGVAFNPSTMTLDRYRIAAWARLSGGLLLTGKHSVVCAFPTLLSTGDLDTFYTALEAHAPSLSGLI